MTHICPGATAAMEATARMAVMNSDWKMSSRSLSLVVPVFNERESLMLLLEEITERLSGREYTIIFVDDGSTDGSLKAMREFEKSASEVEVVSLDRHRGKSAALAAGFERASGDVVLTMDSDLQDDPKEIPRLLEALDGDVDMVCGWKSVRRDSGHRRAASRVYNFFVTRLFGLKLHDVNCGLKAMRAEVAQSLELSPGMHRLIPVLAASKGFRVAEIPVEHRVRRFGKSKYGFGRYFRGAIDVLTLWIRLKARGENAAGG